MAWQPTAIVAAQAARPLRHWSGAQLERTLRTIESVLSDWGTRWQLTAGVLAAANMCDAAATIESETQPWTHGHLLWLSAGRAEPVDALRQLFFGHGGNDRSNSPIAHELASQALADLLRSLDQMGGGTAATGNSVAGDGSPPQADGRRWSGAVRIRLEIGRDDQLMTWQLHCGETLASTLCGGTQPRAARRAALAQVADAIALQPLRFKVCLDETTLTLGTLQSLQVGDVLPLSHRLDLPLNVIATEASSDSPSFCAAYLGSRGHHRAVELVPGASASHQIDS